MSIQPGAEEKNWFDEDPWVDMAVVRVSRDSIVRLAVVKALKSTSEVSLASLPEVAEHIQTNYGLSRELAEQGLALHVQNLRMIRSGGYPQPEGH